MEIMNSATETKSFEVIKVMITVLNEESGSKATIGKFYKLGAKKNGDKYITITGIPEFYKRNAESLTDDAIVIKVDNPIWYDAYIKLGKEMHQEIIGSHLISNNELMLYQTNLEYVSTNWIDDMGKVEIIFPRMPKIIELKITPKYFEAQRRGVKSFEIRKNDRGYRVDDVLWLEEYDPEKKQYTGHTLKRKITYITSYKQQEDYVVLGTAPIRTMM